MKTTRLWGLYMALCLTACQNSLTNEEIFSDYPIDNKEEAVIPEISESLVEFDDHTLALLDLSGGDCLTREQIKSLFFETKATDCFVSGIESIERLFPDAGEWEERHRKAGLHRWYKVRYAETLPRTKAEESLGTIPGAVTVETTPPMKMTGNSFPFNDPYGKSDQWQYFNDGSIYPGFLKGCDINVVPVWEEFTGGSPEVTVAVVDDGIYANHPDLKGVVIPGGSDGSKNFVRNNYQMKAGDHGTHVAGIIGAINNNRVGCCGVAGGLDGKGGVRILSCQIFEEDPVNPDKVVSGNSAEAIVWAADHGAVICQNSWGYDFENETQAQYTSIPSSLKTAIDYFIDYAGTDRNGNQAGLMKGGLVVFASGNDGWKYGCPAEYERVIAVGAVGPDGRKTNYSNYGDWVDICAPGGDYQRFKNSNGLSYILSLANAPNNYLFMCGTSMACPMVSGVAALLVSQFGGEGFTNEMLWNLIIDNANTTMIPANDRIGGMVDAYASFIAASKGTSSIKTDYEGNFKLAVGETLSVDYYVDNDQSEYFQMSLESDGSVSMSESGNGRCTLVFDSSEKYVGKHKAILSAKSKYNRCKLSISYEIYRNQPPVISISEPEKTVLKWFEELSLEVQCTDPEQQAGIVNTMRCVPERMAKATDTKDGLLLTVGNGKGDYHGKVLIEISSKDKHGAESKASLEFEILENSSPIQIKAFTDQIIRPSEDKVTIDGQSYFDDPDGEQLNISYDVSDNTVVKMSSIGDGYVIRGGKIGWTLVTITAADGLGKSCSGSFRIGVYDDSKGPTIFPNPVKDKLTIRIGAEDTVSLEIFSEMGAKVFSHSGKASIFEPLTVDLSSLAPGRYPSQVTCGGKTYKKEIVKL